MKRILALCVALAVALPAGAAAQGKADLTGTWTLDEAKSDPAPQGRGGGRGGGATASKLVIKQTANEITIESTNAMGVNTAVYKLDGSESVNKMAMGESKAKATWEGGNLVIAGSQQLQTPNGTFDITTKDTYAVQGGVLTVTASRTTGRGDTSRKLVYNKG
jgi:hypothetical protein